METILFDDWDKGPTRTEVIIISTEDKMYSREEVKEIFHAYRTGANDKPIFDEWFDKNY